MQGIGEVDDEMTYVRFALYENLVGPIDIRRWPTYARRIPAAVVTDCRGVYDALARSSSSCLGLKDKKSGLEALAIKQSLINLNTSLRWCHSFAQLADCMTKDDAKSRESLALPETSLPLEANHGSYVYDSKETNKTRFRLPGLRANRRSRSRSV